MGQGIISRSNPGNSGDKVGDIRITTRNTLGDKWALCNGEARIDSDIQIDPMNPSCWNDAFSPDLDALLNGGNNIPVCAYIDDGWFFIIGQPGGMSDWYEVWYNYKTGVIIIRDPIFNSNVSSIKYIGNTKSIVAVSVYRTPIVETIKIEISLDERKNIGISILDTSSSSPLALVTTNTYIKDSVIDWCGVANSDYYYARKGIDTVENSMYISIHKFDGSALKFEDNKYYCNIGSVVSTSSEDIVITEVGDRVYMFLLCSYSCYENAVASAEELCIPFISVYEISDDIIRFVNKSDLERGDGVYIAGSRNSTNSTYVLRMSETEVLFVAENEFVVYNTETNEFWYGDISTTAYQPMKCPMFIYDYNLYFISGRTSRTIKSINIGYKKNITPATLSLDYESLIIHSDCIARYILSYNDFWRNQYIFATYTDPDNTVRTLALTKAALPTISVDDESYCFIKIKD